MTGRHTAAKRLHLRITGRVQGVGFRYAALAAAQHLGVRGWVGNTDDGAVELLAEGDEQQLGRLLAWCHAGPPGARVTAVEPQWLGATGEFNDFRIQH